MGMECMMQTLWNLIAIAFSISLLFSCLSADPDMLYGDGTSVWSVDLDTGAEEELVQSRFTIVSDIDFDYEGKKLFVSDVPQKRLYSVDLQKSPPDVRILLATDVSSFGIALDWVNNNLYWTDSG